MREVPRPWIRSTPTPALGSALDFLRVICAVDHSLQRSSKRMETTLGITHSQRLVLRIVGRFPGITAGHLARLLHVHPGTLSGILKRLERRGLLRRRLDPRDGRRTLLGLTEGGRERDIQAEAILDSALCTMLEQTPPDQLRTAIEVLESLMDRMQATELHGSTARMAQGRR